VISPYAKNGVIDHHIGEFSSVLRFIESNWGLSLLTDRDRQATDLSYNFDFTRRPRPPDPLPLRNDCFA
jgi:phospholipase C